MSAPVTSIRLAAPPDRLTISRHNGPGLRIVFWLQGCTLRCTEHCLNPHLLKVDGGFLVSASRLAERILETARDYRGVEGVTVLGGEPFDQAGALAEVLGLLRASGLSTMVYTGHLLEALHGAGREDWRSLLRCCDLLLDGPFIDSLADPALPWRGSTNQSLRRLTDRYSEADIARALAAQGRGLSLSTGPRGDVLVSGAQTPETAARLRALARLDMGGSR